MLISKFVKGLILLLVLFLVVFVYTSIKILLYSKQFSAQKSDVAIVLGAGSHNGKVSPVFRERINHSIDLYKNGLVKKIIFTGGYGKLERISDSESAKIYALNRSVAMVDILIEKKSTKTYENIAESKIIMDSLKFKTALLVSDPLHMKRAIYIAYKQQLICKPSPTKTSMYRTFVPKFKSLIHEAYYYLVVRLFNY